MSWKWDNILITSDCGKQTQMHIYEFTQSTDEEGATDTISSTQNYYSLTDVVLSTDHKTNLDLRIV